jgi:hypothetical protein
MNIVKSNFIYLEGFTFNIVIHLNTNLNVLSNAKF